MELIVFISKIYYIILKKLNLLNSALVINNLYKIYIITINFFIYSICNIIAAIFPILFPHSSYFSAL